MRGEAERIADVRRLLGAAARVASDPAIVAPLVESTGLSREGVVLGLTRHLETRASDEELALLLEAAGDAPSVHVILSASVFVAPLRAIAIAIAASEQVTVKASRREPHFASALVRELGDPRVRIAEPHPSQIERGEIHVYGRDETISAVRAAVRPGVRVRGHGAGMGVALVTGAVDAAAARLAEDVVAFDQRGCLSPRVAFVAGDAPGFARALFAALETRGADVPRGRPDRAEAAELALWTSTVGYAGMLLEGASCAVGVMDRLAVPPAGRHLLVVPIASPRELLERLGPVARAVITVGSDADPALVRELAPAHARVAPLGQMQRPPLDGPVDRREPR